MNPRTSVRTLLLETGFLTVNGYVKSVYLQAGPETSDLSSGITSPTMLETL